MCVCVLLYIQVLSDSSVQELRRWCFQANTIHTKSAESIPPIDHHSALCTLLYQLSALHAPQAHVILREWHWTHAMARTLSSALATDLSHLKVGVSLGTALTDDLLGLATLMGPRLAKLKVDCVALSTDHSHEPWPLPEGCQLGVGTMDLVGAVRLPGGTAAGQGGAGMVCCRNLVLDVDTLTQVTQVRGT